MQKISLFFIILFCFLVFSCFCFGIVFCVFVHQIDKNTLAKIKLPLSQSSQMQVLSSNETNTLIVDGKLYIKLDDLPNHTKNAFIAVEDKNFFSHKGFNQKRIAKAFFINLFSAKPQQGASTISQQLVKNLFLSNEKTFKRKVQELYLTTFLEKYHTKNEILECYLNSIYFGHGIYGIEEASLSYFNKSASNLDVAQSALLAGIINAPSRYDPQDNFEKANNRKNFVLQQMLNENYLTKQEFLEAKLKNLELNVNLKAKTNAYFSNSIKEAQNILQLDEKEIANGYKIYSYLDENLQNQIKEKINLRLKSLNKNLDFCVVVMDNSNHGILGLVSSKNFLPKRQPGSLIKPLLCYAPAFEMGILSPASPILDEQTSFGDWIPKNVDNSYEGYISCRTSLVKSKNIPAIKTLEYVGIENAKSYLKKMNINFDNEDKHLALALGSMKNGLTPLEMTACYSTFACDGEFGGYHLIKKIEDKNGNLVFKNTKNSTKIFSNETAFLMNDVLCDVSKNGTSKKLGGLPFKVASKTGTVGFKGDSTNTDAWCCAYNKNYCLCVWIGNTTKNSKNNLLKTQNGGTICSSLCKDIFEILPQNNCSWFSPPNGVEKINFDLTEFNTSHKLLQASPNTPQRFTFSDFVCTKFKPKQKLETKKIDGTKKEELSSFQKVVKHWFFKD